MKVKHAVFGNFYRLCEYNVPVFCYKHGSVISLDNIIYSEHWNIDPLYAGCWCSANIEICCRQSKECSNICRSCC